MQSLSRSFQIVIIAISFFAFVLGFAQPAEAVLTAKSVQIVDCLLPGKIKKLGLQRTYITHKRPIKTSTNDCAIRGGEYTEYDRADIESALRVWQSSAILGDAEAQFYVGEILENGMDREPDYQGAFRWYQQAADQGYSPAIMNLGRLHEAGLGVEKDLVKAMNLYRQASGLEGEEIEYASIFEKIRQKDLSRISSLESDLEQEKARSHALSQRLSVLQQKLERSKINAQKLQQEIEQRQSELDRLETQSRIQPSTETNLLQAELAEANSELQSQLLLIATLKSELDMANQGSKTTEFILQELTNANGRLAAHAKLTKQRHQQIQELQGELLNLKQALQSSTNKQQVAAIERQFAAEQRLLQDNLRVVQNEINQQNSYIAELELALDDINKNSEGETTVLRYKLENAKQALNASQQTYRQQSEQVASLQQELELLKQSISDPNSKSSTLALQKKILEERERSYQQQIGRLSDNLAKKSQTVSLLATRLTEAQSGNQNRQRYINNLKRKIDATQIKLIKTKQTVQQKDQQIKQAYMEIETLQRDIKKMPTSEIFAQLQAVIALKEQALKKEKQITQRLNQSILQLQAKQQQTSARLAKIAPKDGPVIAVRWPKHTTANGLNASVASGSIVNVVGAVYPPKTVTDFKINGKTERLDANGLFLTTVEIANSDVELTFSATDDLGRISTEKLTIQPSDLGNFALDGTGVLTRPNVNFGKFYALVIGNDRYQQKMGWQSLRTAKNDARVMADLLKKKYDFRVTLKLDVSRDEMLVALEEMRRKLTESDNLLIYYAGHGYMDPENDQGYWIPIDGSTTSTTNWISNSTITDQIRAMSARNVMVIADSCYSASLMRSGIVTLRSGLSPQRKMQRLKEDLNTITRVALSSGGLQPVADAIDNSGHSVFANALLKSLKKNTAILDGDSLFTEVSFNVAIATQNHIQQVPRYAPLAKGGHQGGEFYFVVKNQ